MSARAFNVLFLCTGNSARSILAEALLNHVGAPRLRGFSAGSFPKGRPHPMALQLLEERGLPTAGLRSKSWDEFASASAPAIDLVITVCDQAAAETCPVWPGAPAKAHWGIKDPAAVQGPESAVREAFLETLEILERRALALAALPWETLTAAQLSSKAQAIAEAAP